MRYKLPLLAFLGLLAIGGGIFVASGQTVSRIADVATSSMAFVDGVPAANIAYINGRSFSSGGGGGGGAFTPADLPGLLTWHDASDSSTITHSSGAVSQWNDKSGNGHHVYQSNAAEQPTTGTRSENGLNLIDFSGSDEWMETDGAMTAISQPYTIMTLLIVDGCCNQVFAGYHSDIVTAGYIGYAYNSGDDQFVSRHPNFAYTGVKKTANITSFMTVVDGANTDGYINGGTDLISTSPGTGNWAPLRIGQNGHNQNNSSLDGGIAEVIIADGALSTSDLNNVGNYWADKWGVSWTDI